MKKFYDSIYKFERDLEKENFITSFRFASHENLTKLMDMWNKNWIDQLCDEIIPLKEEEMVKERYKDFKWHKWYEHRGLNNIYLIFLHLTPIGYHALQKENHAYKELGLFE